MKQLAILFPTLALALTLTLLAGRSIPAGGAPEAEPAPAPMRAAPTPEIISGDAAPTPAQLANGARVYRSLCAACHLPDGRGITGATPPLANADYLLADRERAVRIILQGLHGPITVNHISYNSVMPPLGAVLTDRQAADVLTYVLNSWGNSGVAISPDLVAGIRNGER